MPGASYKRNRTLPIFFLPHIMDINLYFLFHSIYLGNHSLPVHRNLLPLLFLQLHSSYYVDVPQFTHLGWSFRLFPYRISQIMLPWITLYTSRLYLWRYILEMGLLGLTVNVYTDTAKRPSMKVVPFCTLTSNMNICFQEPHQQNVLKVLHFCQHDE